MKRNLSSKLCAIAAVVAALSTGALARDLTVVSWGGAYQDAQREVYFKPFMATGTKMAEESWDGGVGTLRAKIQGGSNNWDVVQVESEELLPKLMQGITTELLGQDGIGQLGSGGYMTLEEGKRNAQARSPGGKYHR